MIELPDFEVGRYRRRRSAPQSPDAATPRHQSAASGGHRLNNHIRAHLFAGHSQKADAEVSQRIDTSHTLAVAAHVRIPISGVATCTLSGRGRSKRTEEWHDASEFHRKSTGDASFDYDTRRSAWLVRRGYAVLRFSNRDVLEGIEGVAPVVETALHGKVRPGDWD
ncbi:MAG: DUF559 domain-containing protein [Steroidobacteraceae bacterium]